MAQKNNATLEANNTKPPKSNKIKDYFVDVYTRFLSSKVNKSKERQRLYVDYEFIKRRELNQKALLKINNYTTRQNKLYTTIEFNRMSLEQKYEMSTAKAEKDKKYALRLKYRALREKNKRIKARLLKKKVADYDKQCEMLDKALSDYQTRLDNEFEMYMQRRKETFEKMNQKNKQKLAKTQQKQKKPEIDLQTLRENFNKKIIKYSNNVIQKTDKKIEYNHKICQFKQDFWKKRNNMWSELLLKQVYKETRYSLPKNTILDVKDLCMYFGGIKAVDGLDFDVKRGEIFGLIGPNGAGKTTVFNCITQFYKPTRGTLLFETNSGNIISLTHEKVHNVILHGIVRTFQNVEVIKEVTVLENLLIAAHRQFTCNMFEQALHLPILKREEKVIRARAEQVLNFMGLSLYKDFLAFGLPYGVLKKIEIARTLMSNPQLIILDEPAAGLNDTESIELAKLIRKIRDEYKTTILLVEHDMGLVMDVCDRICAISFGKKLAIGTPEQIQHNKLVQSAYLGVEED